MAHANIPNFDTNHLKAVPEFDGNAHTLTRFISACELLLNNFYNNQDIHCYQNQLIIHCLVGKLVGNARLVAEAQPVDDWTSLKNVLTRNFSDSRNEENLIIDLTNMRQKSGENAQSFYERCLTQLAALNARCSLHEPVANKPVKFEQYTKLTLSIFLNGLFEPLRTNILNMQPRTLSDAINYIKERENNNAIFNRHRNTSSNPPNNQKPKPIQQFQRTPVYQPQQFYPLPNISQTAPQNFNNQFSRPTQQNFSRPFSQQTKNVFAPNPNNQNLYKPTPMSGISTYTARPLRNNSIRHSNFSRNTNNNRNRLNPVVEELFNTENADINNEHGNVGDNTNEHASFTSPCDNADNSDEFHEPNDEYDAPNYENFLETRYQTDYP